MAAAGVVELVQLAVAELVQGRLPDIDLLKMLISKMLGYLVLAGASFVKVPQILDVVRARSAEGLNQLSIELETLGFFVHFCYGAVRGLPFNVYGESLLLLGQTLALLLLVNRYAGAPLARSAAVVTLLAGGAAAVYTGAVTAGAVGTAYELNNVVFTAARVPQIATNFRNGSTGQLNIVTAVMNLGGSLVRIFTSIQEGGGAAMVRGYILGAALNFTLFAQILYYGKGKGAAKKPKKKRA